MAGEPRLTITVECRVILGARGVVGILVRPPGTGRWRLVEPK